VLVDPWNEVEHVWRINETETGYTNQALRELKRLTRRFQIALIIVTHPSKAGGMNKGVGDMSLYDISGSAAWKNKADHGVIVSRESPTAIETLIKIDKSKDFKTMGHPGVVRMRFEPERAWFSFVGAAPHEITLPPNSGVSPGLRRCGRARLSVELFEKHSVELRRPGPVAQADEDRGSRTLAVGHRREIHRCA
jgi:hypothetical protein